MLEIRQRSDGVSITVRVTPKARQANIGGIHDGALKVAVTEPADRGRANDGVVRAVSDLLQISRSQVAVLTGHTARRKTLLTIGVSAEVIETRCR